MAPKRCGTRSGRQQPELTATAAWALGGAKPGASNESCELALVELQNGDTAPTYVAGTANFYAVTRYKGSSDYAMAVTDWGEAVARAVRVAR